jgi:AAA15 family ATPase/GTPase
MLVYYSATNFRSINDRIELNMKAENRLRRHKDHVVSLEGKNKLNILRSSVIYGANASGKSNIIKSMSFAKELITKGSSKNDGIDNEPFLLKSKKTEDESSFYFEFTDSAIDDATLLFSYGVRLDKDRIIEESLYEIIGKKEFCVFERNFINESYEISNQLFLNEYKKKDIHKKIPSTQRQILPSIFFFFARLNLIFPNSRYGGLHDDFYTGSTDYLANISEFDTGINKFSFKNISLSKFSDECIDYVHQQFKKNDESKIEITYDDEDFIFEKDSNSNIKAQKLMSVHNLQDGNSIEFDLEYESDGTKRLLDLLPALSMSAKYSSIDLPSVFIIDEFDRSLHPLLSKKFFEMFLSAKYGSKNDQLIVTTHESSLLDNELLRRDEIWFSQKEHDQSTKLYSLSEYSTRFDKDIEKAYLQGRYGAIPNLIKTKGEG